MPDAWVWGIFGLALGAFTVAFIAWVFWIQHVRQIYLNYDNHNRLSRVPESWREPPSASDPLAQVLVDIEMFRAPLRHDMGDDLKSNLRWHKCIIIVALVLIATLPSIAIAWKLLSN